MATPKVFSNSPITPIRNFWIEINSDCLYPSEILFPPYSLKLYAPGSIPQVETQSLHVVHPVISSKVSPILIEGGELGLNLPLKKDKSAEEESERFLRKSHKRRKRERRRILKEQKVKAAEQVSAPAETETKIVLQDLFVRLIPLDMDEIRKLYKVRQISGDEKIENFAEKTPNINVGIKKKYSLESYGFFSLPKKSTNNANFPILTQNKI